MRTLKDRKIKDKKQNRGFHWAYLLYYFTTLVFNFPLQPTCTTKKGDNITRRFEFLFMVGFIILVVDLINTNVISFFLQIIQKSRVTTNKDRRVNIMLTISNVVQWIIGILILTVSLH